MEKLFLLNKLEDDLFSQKMIGDGYAIKPTSEVVYAPVSGKLIEVADAKHAYYIETDTGLKILIHIGIDTSVDRMAKDFRHHLRRMYG